jgi:hypothetical protein
MLKTTTLPLQIDKNTTTTNNNNNNNLENIEIKKNNCMQYSVNQHVFNPDKFSPPNQWNIRLLNRFSRSNTTVDNISRII